MGQEETIVLRIKTLMDNGDVKGAVKEMQSSFSRLGFSDNISNDFDKIFKDIIKEAEQFESRVNGSFEKIGDVNALKKNANNISGLFSKLTKELSQMSNKDMSEIFNIDVSGVTKINKKIEELQQKISQISSGSIEKVSSSFKELSSIWKNAGKSDIIEQLKSGDLEGASASFEKLEKHLIAFTRGGSTAKAALEKMMSALNTGDIQSAENALNELLTQAKGADTTKFKKFGEEVIKIGTELTNAKQQVQQFGNEIVQLQDDKMSLIATKTEEAAQNLRQLNTVAKTADSSFDNMKGSILESARATQTLQQEIQEVGNRAAYFLSLENMVDLFRQGVQKAIDTVKELDKAMTETAVVTDFGIGDMWDALPRYTKAANELGTTTLGAYETMTLFYQQGLKTNEVFEIGTETMKMARIAGLDYADATNLMTAALRGFNMELNEASAQKINDVYSELAAITAADTNEIATAMTKTASIAANANMEFETTAALLSQIIETTREPAETAGTAMKTIIARFTEMKKSASDIVNVEGEEVNVNKVEAALRDAGVALRDANGEFRDLDDVFLELSCKWVNLDQMTQRYVATMAAGSRQQSRFIAMMQDYERTMELVGAAYDSTGASQKQFEKTQESLESKLNRLNNAFDTFLMGIADDKIIKGFVDVLTELINQFNKATEKVTGLGGSLLRLGVVFAGLRLAKLGVDKAVIHFVNLKKSVDGVASSAGKLTLLTKLTQKINNFKLGQGFVLDVDIDKKGFEAKKKRFSSDWSAFINSLKSKSKFNFSGFEKFDDGTSKLLMKSAKTGEIMETKLSAAGTAALLAGKSADEFGKELTEAGLEGKVAQELLQKEIDQTILKMNALNEGTVVVKDGKIYKEKDLEKIKETQQKLDDLNADQANVVNTSAQGTGTMATGFSSLGSSIAGALPYILAVAAALAAIAATAYIIYNASPLKKAKNEAELAAGAVNDYSRALEKANEETSALSSILNELKEREQIFDNLVAGSVEWYQNISDINEKLLEQISLLQQLGYNIDYSYDENGMIQVKKQEQLRSALMVKEQQKTELQKGQTAATYGEEVASKKSQFIDQNFDKEKEAFGERFLKGMGITTAAAGTTLTGFTGAGAAIGTAIAPGVGTALLGTVGFGLGSITSLAEMAVGTIGSLIHAAVDGTKKIEEVAHNGAYDGLTKDQKEALDNNSREAAAATWKLYAKNEKQLEAGLRIIQHTDNAYEHFYSNEALSKQLGDKFEVADFGNSELVYKGGKDIKASDIDEDFLKDLGYSGWNEAAQAIGLQWDSTKGGVAGLYTTIGEGDNQKKQYFDVTDHGQVDKESRWEDLMADPSGKNIDAGFLALRLAKMKGSSTGLAGTISDVLDEKITKQILYGTEDWEKEVKDSDIDNKIDETTRKAIASAINQVNEEKKELLSSIEGTVKTDKNGEDIKVFEGISDKTLKNFATNIQKIATDVNETTALAYQGFISSKMASLDNVTDQTLQNLENQYQEVFSQIDVTDSIGTLDSLNQMISEGVSEAKELKDNLIATGSISVSKSFKQLYKSGILDELGNDIAKISDEAGNIDVTATRELVDSNVELKKIMDEFNVSGYAMGKILTDIQSGEITLTEINNGLVESYKTLYSAMGQAEDVLYNLRNADLGEDYTEIGRTYEERYNTIKDLYDRKAYGSENFSGNIKSLIGDNEWQKYLNNNGGNAKTAWEKVSSDYKLGKNNGNLYGSFSSLISSKKNSIFSNQKGKISYDLSGFEDYDAVLDHMVSSFGISREYAKAMLADMSTYSATLQEDLNKLNAVANANMAYSKMYHVNDENGNTTASYTNMSDAEIRTTFKDTNEWKEAEKNAKEKKGEEKYDELDADDQIKEVTKSFKDLNKIINTIEIDGEERKIDKVDSQGNKFYKDDENNVKMSKSDNFDTIDVALDFSGDAEADLAEIQRLTEDEQVIQAATELSDEEFQAWIAAYTGNEAVYQAMIEAGVTPQSLASVAAAKDEMITQIQAVALALQQLEVTIPIKIPVTETQLTVAGIPLFDVGFNGLDTSITIGGSDTKVTPIKTSGTGGTSGTGSNKYTAPTSSGTGTGYDGGHDYRNGSNGGGGGNEEKNDTNPKLENLKQKLENIERKYENGEMGAIEYETSKMSNLTQQKAELQKDVNKAYQNSKYKDYIYYDEESDSYLLDEKKFNSVKDPAVRNDIVEEQKNINGKNSDLNDVEDAILQLKDGNQYDTTNEKAKIEALDRLQENKKINQKEYSKERKENLNSQKTKLKQDFQTQLADSKNNSLFQYSEEFDTLLLNQEEFNKLSEKEQQAVLEEYEALKKINDELNEIEDEVENTKKYLQYDTTNTDVNEQALDRAFENGEVDPLEYQSKTNKNLKAEDRRYKKKMDDLIEEAQKDAGAAYYDPETRRVMANSLFVGEMSEDEKKNFDEWLKQQNTKLEEIFKLPDGEREAAWAKWKKEYQNSGYGGLYYYDEITKALLNDLLMLPTYEQASQDTAKTNVQDYEDAAAQKDANKDKREGLTPKNKKKKKYWTNTANIEQQISQLDQDLAEGKTNLYDYYYGKVKRDTEGNVLFDKEGNVQREDGVIKLSQDQAGKIKQEQLNTLEEDLYDKIKVGTDEKGNDIYESVYLKDKDGMVTGINYDLYYKLGPDLQAIVDTNYEQYTEQTKTVEQLRKIGKDVGFISEEDHKLVKEAQVELYNAAKDEESIKRQQSEIAGYSSIIGKLPSEIQGPLSLITDAATLVNQSKENLVLKEQEESSRKEFEGIWANLQKQGYSQYLIYDGTTVKINEEATVGLSDEIIADIKAKADEANKPLKEANDYQQQRSGGIFQKSFYIAEKSAKAFSKALDGAENGTAAIDTAFRELEKVLGLTENSLADFQKQLMDRINNSETLKKGFTGFNQPELLKAIKDSPLSQHMGEDTLEFLEDLLGSNQNQTIKDVLSSGLGAAGEIFGFSGDVLSFNNIATSLNMLNTVKGMIDQAKQWVEQIIGYISQTTQILITAWTNREDYLYNFLKSIEKHLKEYANLQRYSTQLEKGRLSTSQDILNNWNEQWKSLQLQLEEQTERLEERQEELNRSRWNPFALISGWDPTSDTLYENREVKMLWDIIIGLGEAFAPLGTGAFFTQLNQLYDDYDQRVQNSYADRLAAEQALLDLEDQRLELVKVGADEATEFETKLLESLIQKEQEAIDELSRLNDAVTDANSKLLSTLRDNLDKIRQDRENEKREEELGEKERRLAYLRQDTSGANLMEIKKLEEELDKEYEDYTDTLIDQKISELEKQNELAADQRQQQIDLLQGQLDYAEKYGLYWDAVYGMLYTIDENGVAILNPENFDPDGNIRENSELAKLLGTFSDRMGMSTWSQVLDNEETKRLGRYYGAFIGMNGVDGNWANYWALLNPGANDPNYTYPQQEIPDGLWGVLYRLEIGIKKYFGNSNFGLVNGVGRIDESFKNFFGKLFGNDELANYKFPGFNAAHVESTIFAGIKNTTDDMKAWFASGFDNLTKGIKSGANIGGTQNYGDITSNYNFNIGTVGENISIDELTDRVTSAIKGLFQGNINAVKKGR